MIDFAAGKMSFHEYLEALEEERKKIMVFQRELPLCLELVNQAIEACKQQMSGTTTECVHGGQSDECCSDHEHASCEAPVLEEFIPTRRSMSSDAADDNDEQHSNKSSYNDHKKKADWLRSTKLWNQSSDLPSQEDVDKKDAIIETKRNGGAFQPFHRETSVEKTKQSASKPSSSNPTAAASNSSERAGGGSQKKDMKGQSQRKQRRCWSPELHRRFLDSLQQLGGPNAATPKQIRELMKVDGLTNDEVKSHLQKYRLHASRPSPPAQSNGNSQAPQFVVVSGIWMRPPEYATVAASNPSEEAVSRIYAPVAALAPAVQKSSGSPEPKGKFNQTGCLNLEERGRHSECHHDSHSPATSCSTHNTPTSR